MHEPVLVSEVIDYLHIQNNAQYIDATLGAAGHSLEILKRGGMVLGIEADPAMLKFSKKRVGEACPTLVLGNFRDIAKIARGSGFTNVSGILFDLGISSIHFDTDARGFSFKDPSSPLDMRLNPEVQAVTAADLLNSLDQTQLTNLFESSRLARDVVNARKFKKFALVGDLLSLFEGKTRGKIHPATKAFMDLRIAVNSELDNIAEALPDAFDLLAKGGKLCVISFHSGEDRIVKENFRRLVDQGIAEATDLILPSQSEVERNPRSRSAKMRVLTKL